MKDKDYYCVKCSARLTKTKSLAEYDFTDGQPSYYINVKCPKKKKLVSYQLPG